MTGNGTRGHRNGRDAPTVIQCSRYRSGPDDPRRTSEWDEPAVGVGRYGAHCPLGGGTNGFGDKPNTSDQSGMADRLFEFSEDHEGTIEFSVVGDYRYEGFFLSGHLTPTGTMDPRKSAPILRSKDAAKFQGIIRSTEGGKSANLYIRWRAIWGIPDKN